MVNNGERDEKIRENMIAANKKLLKSKNCKIKLHRNNNPSTIDIQFKLSALSRPEDQIMMNNRKDDDENNTIVKEIK